MHKYNRASYRFLMKGETLNLVDVACRGKNRRGIGEGHPVKLVFALQQYFLSSIEHSELCLLDKAETLIGRDTVYAGAKFERTNVY